MVEFTTEPSTEGPPVGTKLSDLVGTQCFIAAGHGIPTVYRRCMKVAVTVMVTQCTQCDLGGMIPMCDNHTKLAAFFSAQLKDGECPKCGAHVNVSEPVEIERQSAPVTKREPEPLSDDYGEMDW